MAWSPHCGVVAPPSHRVVWAPLHWCDLDAPEVIVIVALEDSTTRPTRNYQGGFTPNLLQASRWKEGSVASKVTRDGGVGVTTAPGRSGVVVLSSAEQQSSGGSQQSNLWRPLLLLQPQHSGPQLVSSSSAPPAGGLAPPPGEVRGPEIAVRQLRL